MLGLNNVMAHNRRRQSGPGLRAMRRGNVNTPSPIDRGNWLSVEPESYAHPARTYMWEPCMLIHCPMCMSSYPPGSKHWTGDERQGCRPIQAIEKIQHGLLVANRRVENTPKIFITVNAVQEMMSVGLNLEDCFKQERNWLPNEDMFGFAANGAWEPNGFNILNAYNNLISANARLPPVAQDPSLENDNAYARDGPSTYATHNIQRRQELRKQEVYDDVLPTLTNAFVEHAVLLQAVASYRLQIEQAKAAVNLLVTNNVISSQQADTVLDCFASNGNPLYVAAPPPHSHGVTFQYQNTGNLPATPALHQSYNYVQKIYAHQVAYRRNN